MDLKHRRSLGDLESLLDLGCPGHTQTHTHTLGLLVLGSRPGVVSRLDWPSYLLPRRSSSPVWTLSTTNIRGGSELSSEVHAFTSPVHAVYFSLKMFTCPQNMLNFYRVSVFSVYTGSSV